MPVYSNNYCPQQSSEPHCKPKKKPQGPTSHPWATSDQEWPEGTSPGSGGPGSTSCGSTIVQGFDSEDNIGYGHLRGTVLALMGPNQVDVGGSRLDLMGAESGDQDVSESITITINNPTDLMMQPFVSLSMERSSARFGGTQHRVSVHSVDQANPSGYWLPLFSELPMILNPSGVIGSGSNSQDFTDFGSLSSDVCTLPVLLQPLVSPGGSYVGVFRTRAGYSALNGVDEEDSVNEFSQVGTSLRWSAWGETICEQ